MRLKFILGLIFLVATASSGQPPASWCGLSAPEPSVASAYSEVIAATGRRPIQKALLPISIAFHVITDGKNGKVTQQQIDILINNINWAYKETPFRFYLARVDVTKNKAWFSNCNSNAKNQKAMKKRLARDTRYYVNIYSCNPFDPAASGTVLGMATFPFLYPNGSFMHGILVHPSALPGGAPDSPYGLVAAHELGHYLGLFHTFEKIANPSGEACSDPGDHVADTPTQAGPHYSCPTRIDTCPALPGFDDVPNFMNYSTDACMEHFTQGQIDLMILATAAYRPNLGR